MPFKYCTECGYKNVYTTRQAKFCAGCGQSLAEKEITSKSISSHPQSTHAHSEEDSAKTGIPNIQKLEYTVDSAGKPQTIGDLINTKKEGSKIFKREARGSSEALTREELEAESMIECASSKKQSTD